MKNGIILGFCLLLMACEKQDNRSLFDEFFEPYRDLVSGQESNPRISAFLEGMAFYNNAEYKSALNSIAIYSKAEPDMAAPYFYMGICNLALGESAKAELMFDHLDNIVPNGFIDQSQWYTALCLLWSGQNDRCRADLEKILEFKKHAYLEKAGVLLKAMDKNGL